MTLLFISSKDVNMKSNGGFQCTNRNYLSFCNLLGVDNVEVINLISRVKNSIFMKVLKRIYYLVGFSEGLSYKIVNNIVKTAKEHDFVFIDSSTYGVVAYYLKKGNYNGKIICFFHNVEYTIKLQQVSINPVNFLKSFLVYYNEKKACKYSDKIVVLNKRDGNKLHGLYGLKNFIVIPISLSDSYKSQINELTEVPPTLLFVGNNWYANIHGLKWFVNNVLNYVNIKLQIVGSDMDKLEKNFVHPKIEFLGYVPDLSEILTKADYVLSPIFLGGGMKVKTCESLMYGKNIIGTSEAFEGYEIDPMKVGAICRNEEDFIDAIKNYCSIKREKFNKYSRQSFLEKYSFQATLIKYEELLCK